MPERRGFHILTPGVVALGIPVFFYFSIWIGEDYYLIVF